MDLFANKSNKKPILGYWNIRGIAQPIRLLLAYTGVDFEDRRYSLDENGKEWFREKLNLKFDFPNLPYYIDGEIRLTQSIAIMLHIARKHQLDGTTTNAKNRIAIVENQIRDIEIDFYSTIIGESDNDDDRQANHNNTATTIAAYRAERLPAQLSQIVHFLGSNPFIGGTRVSYVDFMLYEYLLRIVHYHDAAIKSHANLLTFIDCIESLPRLAAYIKLQKRSRFVPQRYAW